MTESDGKTERHEFNALVAPLLIFGILHTGGFVWQNTHKEENYPLFREMVQEDPHYSREYYQAYRNRPWGLIAREEYGDINEAIRAWTLRYQADPKDDQNIANLAGYKLDNSDTTGAVNLLRQEWPSFKNNLNILSRAIDILLAARDTATIKTIYDALSISGRVDPQTLYTLGAIKRVLGDMDSCVYYFDLAFRENPSAPIDQAFIFYSLAFKRGYNRVAGEGLSRILNRLDGKDRGAAQKMLDSIQAMQNNR